ncbi:MAG: BNR repeat-containing protein [Myxococcales bacterium]
MKEQPSRTTIERRPGLEIVLVPRSSTALLGILAVSAGCLGACARDTSALSSGSGNAKGGNSSTESTTGGVGATGGSAVGGTSTTGSATGGAPASAGASSDAYGGAAGSTETTSAAGSAGAPPSPIAEVIDVGLTYSSQPTEMSLTTIGNQQFVAYWGGDTRMTVASRMLGETTWKKIALAPTIQHDGHHSIVLAADKKGYLHLSGRMHNEPLTYLRSTVPMDITSFQLQMSMVGTEESSTTYPRFFIGPIGDLIYAYRYGQSGQGDTIFNVYDATSKTWSRLLGTKLIDGQSQNSAYIVGPTKGPDDYWHMVWTWRVDANAETNHDLSYARSKDFLTWETGTGAPLTLPITLGTADIVDPVPTNGGMINNNTKVGFDSQNRPVIVYHKYDGSGATQLYNARVENGKWVTHQTTNWTYRWAFSGMFTLTFEIEVDGVRVHPDGKLKQLYYHAQNGGWGGLLLDEATLASTAVIPPPYPYPAELNTVESTTYGMRARWAADAGSGPDPDIYYMMRWETLEPNQDQARSPEPPPTTLRVYGFRRSAMKLLN